MSPPNRVRITCAKQCIQRCIIHFDTDKRTSLVHLTESSTQLIFIEGIALFLACFDDALETLFGVDQDFAVKLRHLFIT